MGTTVSPKEALYRKHQNHASALQVAGDQDECYHSQTMQAEALPLAVNMPDMIIRAAQTDDIYPILSLHREAFADKFVAAFGWRGSERGVEAMAEAWRRQGTLALRGMLVAIVDQQIVGTISIRTSEITSDVNGIAEQAFYHVLGHLRALRSIMVLSILDHHIDHTEAYITDVAVLSAFRRRGVAQAMLEYVEQEARKRRKRHLGLYVSASNTAARRLYELYGFQPQRIRRSFLAACLLRQSTWFYMRKELSYDLYSDKHTR